MSATPVFSTEYYSNYWLFNNQMQQTRLPNGRLQFESRSFTDFWKYRITHAFVDASGTIATVPFSFFGHLKRYFSFDQDPHLIATHRSLKNLEMQIQNPSSPELQRLKEEIHREGVLGTTNLRSNLNNLSSCFMKANEKSCLTLTLLKVVNCIRKLLNWPPIEFYHYDPIHLELFEQRALRPALELTGSDRVQSQFFHIIHNNSAFPLPPEFSLENLQRLEFGLLSRLQFQIDQKNFTFSYDRIHRKFTLSCWHLEGNVPTLSTLFDRQENYTFRSAPLNIIEKKADASTTVHPLHSSIEYTCERGPWYSPFINSQNYLCKPATMTLTANSEYTIPLSEGNLYLKLYQRT